MATDGEIAAFEVGIKLGALFHQFTGTPVSIKTKSSLEKAMGEAMKNQPYVIEAEVKIDEEMLRNSLKNPFGYVSLEGKMIYARVRIKFGNASFTGVLEYSPEIDYPEMKLVE
ncbi:MAG TPA: hypothetical protein ENH28_01180 [Euryarchaeota archaeon]|nr:hypothetical protein [Euryarchaeota archaeon]